MSGVSHVKTNVFFCPEQLGLLCLQIVTVHSGDDHGNKSQYS